MTQTCYGVVATEDGHASDGTRFWSTPSCQIRAVQDERIPVNVEHGRQVGEAVYLERDRYDRVWLVAHVNDAVIPGVHVKVGEELRFVAEPYYWSAERIGGPDVGGVAFTGAALTTRPARVGAVSRGEEVVFLNGGLDYRQVPTERWHLKPGYVKDMLTRAAASHLDRRRDDPLVVHGHHQQQQHQQFAVAARHQVEVRSVAAVDVHPTRREVDVVISPAESPTVITEGKRRFVEVFSHGAFQGCETEPGRVKVNMHHDRTRTVGRALSLDPWAEEGLVGTLKLARVHDAEEALALIDDDLLGVSAGFGIVSEQWDGTRTRRVRRAVLDHVALTPVPAYASANVLAVRDHALRS